jgi:hypothetical protein
VGDHVGAEVGGLGDLVEQQSGDRADRHQSPVPSCLVITELPSAAISATGNLGYRRSVISSRKLALIMRSCMKHA